ncbi:hypothetical protein HFP15_13915 [Amycolatopsis sp. K13G38]|uniref:Transmembrane protein n=1 Tax=Amycolatopsis acididurans TaxID=2724524 RepID=A0ABX1J4Y2_9PSEU|nr:hypothetical protein [Amycolatopsis acididurans]NKQ53979.1 hypothetical protein [Amycolatopsis acididurans]
METGTPSWWLRWWRVCWRRRPLRRGADTVESLLVLFAVLFALAGVPLAGVLGSTIHGDQLAISEQQQRTRYETTAVTLVNGIDAPAALRGPAQVPVEVPAHWTARDGSPHAGTVFVSRETRAGAVVPVWLDQTGARTTAPTTAGDAALTASLTAIVAWSALAAALAGIVALAHWILDRLRYRAWAREWEHLGRDSSYS